MTPLTTFSAVLYRIGTDREGESRVVFEVPLNQLASVTKLYLALKQVVEITVTPLSSGVIGGRAINSQPDAADA